MIKTLYLTLPADHKDVKNVSKQRIYKLMQKNRFDTLTIGGKVYILSDSPIHEKTITLEVDSDAIYKVSKLIKLLRTTMAAFIYAFDDRDYAYINREIYLFGEALINYIDSHTKRKDKKYENNIG